MWVPDIDFDEIKTAFKSRILTDAMINSNYILEDIDSAVLERVRDTIERHDSVKVNTACNGKFLAGNICINIATLEFF